MPAVHTGNLTLCSASIIWIMKIWKIDIFNFKVIFAREFFYSQFFANIYIKLFCITYLMYIWYDWNTGDRGGRGSGWAKQIFFQKKISSRKLCFSRKKWNFKLKMQFWIENEILNWKWNFGLKKTFQIKKKKDFRFKNRLKIIFRVEKSISLKKRSL